MNKHRCIFLWMIIIIFLGMAAASCGNKVESEGTGVGQDIQVVTVDGHEYILYDGYNEGGITHKANCKARH